MRSKHSLTVLALFALTLCCFAARHYPNKGPKTKSEPAPAPAPAPAPEPAPEPAPAPSPEPAPAPAPDPSPAGWTSLSPSADSLIVYVSSSDGNDADNGLTEATAKQTISAAKSLLRSGYPDWMLLKAGDTWTFQNLGVWSKSGRSASEPMVVGSYGAGARPLLQTGTSGVVAGYDATEKSHVVFTGLHFVPHTYTGSGDTNGVVWLSPTQGLLFEDCVIEGYKMNFVLQADNGPLQNFHVRRCVVADAWSTTMSSGIYAYGIDGLLIEECVFDHNGWKEGPGGSPATMFNHNIYMEECSNVALRGNLFMRASSISTKFRSNSTGASQTLLVENNFYIEGEIGISAGGNTADPLRFSDVTIRNNVMMHIGRTQPTNRDLAWYLEVKDWDGGLIENNLFLHQSAVGNCYGIQFGGSSERNTVVQNNVFHGLQGTNMIVDIGGSETGIVIRDNHLQDPTEGSLLVDHSGSFAAVTYQDNTYFTNASASAWFRVGDVARSYSQWVAASGETGSSAAALSYPAPDRDEATYMASLGLTPSLAAFAAEARLQSKSNWRPEFTAGALNTYVRAGFGR